MRIFIKTLTGENSTLEVESGNSIEDVKEKFEVIEGFPSYQQHFTFCGWPLEDDRILADYMIQNDSTLQMSLKLPPEVLVETPNGETVALRCESRDKRDKKWFVFAGVHVEDGRAFEPFDIPKGSTLYLQLRVTMMCEQVPQNNRTKRPRKVCAIRQAKMRIFVKILTGKTWTLEVESDNSIEDVKEKIEVMEGTPPYRQRLIFSGRDLEDDKTLVNYNIPNAATLYMILRVGGPPGVLVTTPSKKAIALRCESHDIRDEKGLIFTGQHVEDDRVFECFNIPKGSTLHLQLQVKLMCEQLISTSSHSESEQAPQQNLTERPIVADDQKNYGKKLKICALHQAKATEVLEELMSENQAGPTSSEFEDMKREMNTARCKEKEELEAVVSKLVSARCASYETRLADLEAENKKLKLQLSQVAQICRNPESFN